MQNQWKACFGGADLATATAGATGALPILGEPDTADFSAILIPHGGRLVGLQLVGKPASGDTITITPILGGTIGGAGVPTAIITNALPTSLIELGPNDGVLVTQGETIALQYVTSSTGTYGVRDVYAEALVEFLDD